MMIQNLFLATSSCPVPARWREAFPDGAAVGAHELEERALGGKVLWLPAADGQWQARLEALKRSDPAVAVIVASDVPDDDEALRALELGARGYCHARAVPALLREAALAVGHGGLWVGAALLARLLGALRQHIPAAAPAVDAQALLSARELEVAREVANGHSNREVAVRLGISERTVKAHLGAVFDKLAVRDRLQLALRLAPALHVKPGERRDLHQVR